MYTKGGFAHALVDILQYYKLLLKSFFKSNFLLILLIPHFQPAELSPETTSPPSKYFPKSLTCSKNDINVGKMLAETREVLEEYFRPWNHRLTQLLGDNRYQ